MCHDHSFYSGNVSRPQLLLAVLSCLHYVQRQQLALCGATTTAEQDELRQRHRHNGGAVSPSSSPPPAAPESPRAVAVVLAAVATYAVRDAAASGRRCCCCCCCCCCHPRPRLWPRSRRRRANKMPVTSTPCCGGKWQSARCCVVCGLGIWGASRSYSHEECGGDCPQKDFAPTGSQQQSTRRRLWLSRLRRAAARHPSPLLPLHPDKGL